MARIQLCNLRNIKFRSFTSAAARKDAVGTPHPVSNMRPVLYDKEPQKQRAASTTESYWHPYSINEFDGDVHDIQWKIDRQRLDAFNHAFWADVRYLEIIWSLRI